MHNLRSSKFVCHTYYLLFGAVGIGIIPPLVKNFEDGFGLSHSMMGILMGLGGMVFILASFVAGVGFDRSGARWALVATMVVCALATAVMSGTDSLPVFVLALMVFYFGNGLGVIVVPTVGRLYGEKGASGISLLHAMQGVGRLLAPLLIIACIKMTGRWQMSLVVAACLFGAWFFLVLFAFREPPVLMLTEVEGAKPKVLTTLRKPTVLVGLAALFFMSGYEGGIITWLPTLLERERGLTTAHALTAFSCMMVGTTLIRLMLGLSNIRVGRMIYVASLLVLTTSILLVIHTESVPLVYGASFLMGLATGLCFPAWAAALYDHVPHAHGILTSLINVACVTGISVFVALIGWVGDRAGLDNGLFVSVGCGAVFVAIAFVFYGLIEKKGSVSSRTRQNNMSTDDRYSLT